MVFGSSALVFRSSFSVLCELSVRIKMNDEQKLIMCQSVSKALVNLQSVGHFRPELEKVLIDSLCGQLGQSLA